MVLYRTVEWMGKLIYIYLVPLAAKCIDSVQLILAPFYLHINVNCNLIRLIKHLICLFHLEQHYYPQQTVSVCGAVYELNPTWSEIKRKTMWIGYAVCVFTLHKGIMPLRRTYSNQFFMITIKVNSDHFHHYRSKIL